MLINTFMGQAHTVCGLVFTSCCNDFDHEVWSEKASRWMPLWEWFLREMEFPQPLSIHGHFPWAFVGGLWPYTLSMATTPMSSIEPTTVWRCTTTGDLSVLVRWRTDMQSKLRCGDEWVCDDWWVSCCGALQDHHSMAIMVIQFRGVDGTPTLIPLLLKQKVSDSFSF